MAGALLFAFAAAACSPAEGYQIGPASGEAPQQPAQSGPAAATPTPEPTKGAPLAGTGGGGGGATSAFVVDAEAVLRRRLEKLDARNDRAVLRLLEAYGAATPPRSRMAVEETARRLVAALKDERPKVRCGATAALARIDPDSFKGDPFTALFVDPEPSVRREAVLGRMRHGVGSIWIHVVTVSKDPEPCVRAAAATALGTVQHADVTARLVEMLVDPDTEVVAAAGASLERSLAGAPPKALLDACRSEREEVRIAAAKALASLRGPESVAALAPMTDDANWQVRRAALRGLTGVDGPAADAAAWTLLAVAEHPRRTRTDRLAAVQALAKTRKKPDLERLARAAQASADPVLRLGFARTLLAWKDLRSLDLLVDLADLTTEDPMERKSIARIRSLAVQTLEDATTSKGDRAATDARVVRTRSWREKLPEIRALLSKQGVDYAPQDLDDSVW